MHTTTLIELFHNFMYICLLCIDIALKQLHSSVFKDGSPTVAQNIGAVDKISDLRSRCVLDAVCENNSVAPHLETTQT